VGVFIHQTLITQPFTPLCWALEQLPLTGEEFFLGYVFNPLRPPLKGDSICPLYERGLGDSLSVF